MSQQSTESPEEPTLARLDAQLVIDRPHARFESHQHAGQAAIFFRLHTTAESNPPLLLAERHSSQGRVMLDMSGESCSQRLDDSRVAAWGIGKIDPMPRPHIPSLASPSVSVSISVSLSVAIEILITPIPGSTAISRPIAGVTPAGVTAISRARTTVPIRLRPGLVATNKSVLLP